MTPYIAWLGLPSVVVTALWCAFVCAVVEQYRLQAGRASARKRTARRMALAEIRAARWRQRMGVAE